MLVLSSLPIAITMGLSISSICSALAQVLPERGVSAYAFNISQVLLGDSRFLDNQKRTMNYLTWVNVDRLLYNFRANHKLSTNGAIPNGGWDAPDFPFRTHMQGHFLTAWAQCYAATQDPICRDRATYFVAELAKCQANSPAASFGTGYLSGFPESDFTAMETGNLKNGNVPYYAIHKTLAGLLDVWRHIGDSKARDVMLLLAGWVDQRTGKLSYSQMQKMISTEFGGMNEVLSDIFHHTGDQKWLAAAQRFDHADIFDPLASIKDKLEGLHANTQVPKWIGAAREFKATGTSRYKDIARNAWNITVNTHTYAIGGNSQAEHFRAPNAIAQHLSSDTCEACNTYNMLKLTRELWVMDPDPAYFDFYERALLNHLLGQQNPHDNHGHFTYFTPLNPGGRRGVGPAWGGGTWSTDYHSFWCCQGTGIETNTKLMDSIYFYDSSTLFINLFTPSVLDWSQRNVKITQTTKFPASDTTSLRITGSGTNKGNWTMKIRIPKWTSGAEIILNGLKQSVETMPGSYASLSRSWNPDDIVNVRLPMTLRSLPTKDKPNVAAVAFGPVILCGNYGDSVLTSMPNLKLDSIRSTGTSSLAFTANANGQTVTLGPFYDAHGFNYNVYWNASGQLSRID